MHTFKIKNEITNLSLGQVRLKKASIKFRHSKPSDLVIHVVPDVSGMLLKTWSSVCSKTLHLQFVEGARLHLCIDKWNCPTPVCRRLSLTQAVRGKFIPTGLVLFLGMKAPSFDVYRQDCLIDFAQLPQTDI